MIVQKYQDEHLLYRLSIRNIFHSVFSVFNTVIVHDKSVATHISGCSLTSCSGLYKLMTLNDNLTVIVIRSARHSQPSDDSGGSL